MIILLSIIAVCGVLGVLLLWEIAVWLRQLGKISLVLCWVNDNLTALKEIAEREEAARDRIERDARSRAYEDKLWWDCYRSATKKEKP